LALLYTNVAEMGLSNEVMREIACLNKITGYQSIGVNKAGLPVFMKKTKQLPSVRTK
jgi:hypothetical protein